MTSVRNRALIAGILLLLAGLALLLAALAGSRSAAPLVLGRYSPALAAALALLVALCAVMLLALLLFRERLALLAAKLGGARPIPELVASLSVPAVLMLWFLRPVAILDRPAFLAGLLVTAAGLSLTLLSCVPGERRKAVLQNSALVFSALVMAIVGGEILARLAMPKLIFDPRFRLRPHMSYTIESDIPGVSDGGVVTTNSLGLRGEEPPGDFDDWLTIVTVGGSTTINFYLEDSRTWSDVLQANLREEIPHTWVGNAGIPMQSALTHAILVRDVVSQIGPDYVVFLVGGNEMGQFIRGEAGLSDVIGEMNLRTWFFQNSRLVQALYLLKKVHLDGAEVVYARSEAERFEEIPMPGPEGEMPEDLHDLLPRPDAYRNRILRLIEECEDIGAIPVFMTQPLLYEDSEYWRGIIGSCYWFSETDSVCSAATWWRMLETLNTDLIDVCAEEGVACFDLASHVPHERRYFYDSMHHSLEGAALIGELAAGFMLERVLPEGDY